MLRPLSQGRAASLLMIAVEIMGELARGPACRLLPIQKPIAVPSAFTIWTLTSRNHSVVYCFTLTPTS